MTQSPKSVSWSIELLKGWWRSICTRLRRTSSRKGIDPALYFEKLSAATYAEHHLASNDDIFANGCMDLLLPIIKGIDEPRIVDLGCGSGDLLVHLPLENASVTLIDCCEARLLMAFHRLDGACATKDRIHVDLRNWSPSSHHTFDIAISVNVIPYIADLERFFQLCAAIVKKGGILLVAAPVHSAVWEDSFEGVRVLFHSRNTILSAASASNFSMLEAVEIAFRIPIFGVKVCVGICLMFKNLQP